MIDSDQTYGKDTLRPVTIRQLLHALHPHPDAEFKVDGSDITQVLMLVAQTSSGTPPDSSGR